MQPERHEDGAAAEAWLSGAEAAAWVVGVVDHVVLKQGGTSRGNLNAAALSHSRS